MAIDVIMPKFGLSMEEGTIGEWLVREGDAVKKGDRLASVNSEKLTNDALSPEDGILVKILAAQGETLACGERIAILSQPGEQWTGDAAKPKGEIKSAAPAAASAPAAVPAAGAPQASKITPRARKIAGEKGLSYDHIEGTGINGMITVEDLLRFGKPKAAPAEGKAAAESAVPAASVTPIAAETAPSAQPVYAFAGNDPIVKMSPMQSAISRSMAGSMASAAQTTLTSEVEVSGLVATYRSIKERYAAAGVKLSYTAMIVKAVAHALEDHPDARTMTVDGKTCWTMSRMNIGVAVDVPDGLIVPVIRDANLKSLRAVCDELLDLSERARKNRLVESELGNAAITVTNLGMYGVTFFTPILNLPESTILGVGAIVDKPVARNGGFAIAPMLSLSLTHDHRVNNGAPVARFLQEIVVSLNDFKWI
ncbi:MAG: dihydrolipoamide acetyltransferase family protein [Bacillota bacterium]